MSAAARRTGRRSGPTTTRAEILLAARRRFADLGYERATIRGIGRDAGVDPALVHHFFGSKEDLFAAALELPVDVRSAIPALIRPGMDGLGRRLVRFYLGLWESEAAPSMLTVLRSAVSQDRAAQLLREFIGREVIGALARELAVPDAEWRATLVGAQLVGLGLVRYVIRVEPLASAAAEDVVAAVGPTVQRYLTADPPPGGSDPGRDGAVLDTAIHRP